MSGQLDVNQAIAHHAELLDLLRRPDLKELLAEFDYDWANNSYNPTSRLATIISSLGYAERRPPHLTRSGRLFMSRLLLHFESICSATHNAISDKYSDYKLISSGKNSIVFSAKHRLIDSVVVVKVVRPGASENITDSIRRLRQIDEQDGVVLPIDYIRTSLLDLLGRPMEVDCVIFPYVRGTTLGAFLKQENHHLNSQIVLSFALQLSKALASLERIGAYHGDLHEDNIIVDHSPETGLTFRLVDVSYDAMGSLSTELCRNSDIDHFKQHLWRILATQRTVVPTLSIRKYIGTRSYLIIRRILAPETSSFAQIVSILEHGADYNSYVVERDKFLSDKFEAPNSFRLQRYEEITDPVVAVELFVPFDELMNKIQDFGNLYVSGNRGSGKSTYLAALAFFPETTGSLTRAENVFGIYFPCRQGEFKALATRQGWDDASTRRGTEHLLVIKIVRTALQSIAAGIAAGKLSAPSDLSYLRTFVAGFVPGATIVSVSPEVQSEIDNIVSTMVRVEMVAGTRLSVGAPQGGQKSLASLLEFFRLIRQAVPELGSTQFHLLFDDAGVPYVPTNVQQALCDLMLLSNSIFCVKLSAEKLTFSFVSSEGKILEVGQDYVEQDISQVLFIGADKSLRRAELSRYFHRIVGERLAHFRYQSGDILDYVGDGQLSGDELINRLAKGRRDAYYCGWTAVWNIADRTPRNLLEIVSEIFSAANVNRHSRPTVIASSVQNRAIRTISEKRLDSLSQISGRITGGGIDASLGRRLFEVTTAIGSTFRKYLRSSRGATRPRQHLAIERNDLGELRPDAQEVLDRLITFGVLDATKYEYTRDDEARKPIYVLNRIYCPIFGISYRRDDHLRLSKGKMEMLLLRPNLFLRDGTRRLREVAEGGEDDLFTYRQTL